MKTSVNAAGLVIVVLALWMLSGLFKSNDATVNEDVGTTPNLPMAVEASAQR